MMHWVVLVGARPDFSLASPTRAAIAIAKSGSTNKLRPSCSYVDETLGLAFTWVVVPCLVLDADLAGDEA